ncbi:DNA-binding transcriptional regulator GbsR, MarR family [Thermomonospora echinospora]|uniref:DNA-binding transcriptional regulator GbsR, MarR family n=1 Tax=Thermomonospora echinospora TaxID=1992 RepID=A0A1H6E466_9ACTN|nr:MarR family transcriptional regulator [Thermomonospora echinospora]SEG92518.1 DNA-binding transcriptional regulator GbsR, MarR family [Thermomonospora echinospora]
MNEAPIAHRDDRREERDAEALAGFVERFAGQLVDAGMPRMPSRVFAALLTSDAGRMTAAELAEALQASPAAISGAVRYLGHVNMVARERDPGTRRDVYLVRPDVWYEMMAGRDQTLRLWTRTLREGERLAGSGTPAADRLADAAEFFDFMRAELDAMLKRWREHREHREHREQRHGDHAV